MKNRKYELTIGDGNWAKKLRNRWGGIPSVEVERGVWGRRVSRGPASGAPVRHASGVRDGRGRRKREGEEKSETKKGRGGRIIKNERMRKWLMEAVD